AQSWQGLAATDDERYRIAAAADGGIWLLRTPHPEPAAALAGSRPVTGTARQLLSTWRWAHRGSSRLRQAPVADPALIRGLDVGQAAYIYRGGVTYIQVKRLVAAPAALVGQPSRRAGPASPGSAAAEPGATADSGAVADLGALADPAAGADLTAPMQAAESPSGWPTSGWTEPPDATAFLDEAFGPEARP
ncbi:MAG TPA: hypothetical protein VGI64_00075, partial [Streptosporangiaceae bacterium]